MSTDDRARRISIGLDPHGRPIAKKSGNPERLVHEADVLTRVQMPGVVRLVAHDLVTGELSLAWTGGRSLLDAPRPHPPGEVLALVRALARTLAAVHAAGIVHHRIEPSHVLITDDGPVLTGFAEATVAGNGDPGDPHIDVAALGRLIDVLLGPASVPARPVPVTTALGRFSLRGFGPRRRIARHPGGRLGPDLVAVAMRRIARTAQDRSTPACTMTQMCSMLDDLTTPSTTTAPSMIIDTAPHAPVRGLTGTLHDHRRALTVSAVVTMIIGTLIVLPRFAGPGDHVAAAGSPSTTANVDETDSPEDQPTGITRSPSATGATSAAPSTSQPTTSSTTTTEELGGQLIWPPPTPFAADPQQFTVRGQSLEVGVIEADGVRYRMAADPQDRWLTGDWNCDAAASVAMLRVPSGAIDVFDVWPQPGRSVTSRRVAVIAGAVDLAATSDDCPRLAVIDATGNVITVVPS
ncbi:MAG: hypothetical protein AB7V43_12515 [Acidimicrobiia bacterium]